MNSMLSRRARTAAATTVAAVAVCGAMLAPVTAYADDAPATPALHLSVAELPHSPLIRELTRGGEAANFQFTATNSGDAATPFVPEVIGLPVKGTAPITGSLLNFHATPIDAPATDVSLGGQDGAALAYLVPKGKQAGDSFTIPAHGSLSWTVVVGVTKDYPATDSGLKLDFMAEGENVDPASISFSTTGNTVPSAKPLEVSVEEYPGTPMLKTLTPGGPATTFQVDVTNPGDVDEPIAPVLHIFPADESAGIDSRDLTFEAHPVVAPGTGYSGSGQDGAALEFLYPDGGKAGESFSVPAHTQWNWQIVLGLKKNFPVKDGTLKVQIVSGTSDVKTGEVTFAIAGDGTATPTPGATPTATATGGSTGGTDAAGGSSTGGSTAGGSTAGGSTGDANAPGTNGGELAHTGSTGSRTMALLAASLLLAGAGLSILTLRRRRTTGA